MVLGIGSGSPARKSPISVESLESRVCLSVAAHSTMGQWGFDRFQEHDHIEQFHFEAFAFNTSNASGSGGQIVEHHEQVATRSSPDCDTPSAGTTADSMSRVAVPSSSSPSHASAGEEQ